MSFAGSAIILIILLLPGAIAIKGYYTSLMTKQSGYHIPIDELLFKGIILSLISHCTAICVIRLFTGNINLNLLYQIITAKEINIEEREITTLFLEFCNYNIILFLIMFLISKFIKFIIQKKNWDLRFNSLRNNNYWYEIFSARYLEIRGVQGEKRQTDLIFVDILVKSNIIYSGFLHDFNYSEKKDELENILIRNTFKRVHLLNEVDNIPKTSHPSSVPGDILFIDAKEISNINISYIKIIEEESLENVDFEIPDTKNLTSTQ